MTNPDGDIQVVDVTGSLCENNDKFAKNRELPEARIGDTWLSTTQVHMVSSPATTIMDARSRNSLPRRWNGSYDPPCRDDE